MARAIKIINKMAIVRDISDEEYSGTQTEDDFVEKVCTKRKKEEAVTSKVTKKGVSKKRSKTETAKLFRANFGPLHELFRHLEEKDIKLNEKQLDALETSPFGKMLHVFMNKQIKKEQLTKSNMGLEMLVRSFATTEDGYPGFKLQEGVDAIRSTPEDMAIILGLQLIDNGIEDKLQTERKITASCNDLCKKYNFGQTKPNIKSTEVQDAVVEAIKNEEVDDVVRLIVFYMCQTIFFSRTGNFGLPCNFLVYVKSVEVINRISWPHLIHKAMIDSIVSSKGDTSHITGCTFYLLYWFAEHSNIERRSCAETMTPRFARWDTSSISKVIVGLEMLPCTKKQSEKIKFSSGLQVQVDCGYEMKLITPTKQTSRLETMKQRVVGLETENICLIQEMDEKKNRLCVIQMRLRIEKNRLIAIGIRDKVDATPSIFVLMQTTLEQIFREFGENIDVDQQVQPNEELLQSGEAPHEDNEKSPQQQYPLAPSRSAFSLGLTQYYNNVEPHDRMPENYHSNEYVEDEDDDNDVANFEFVKRGKIMKETSGQKVSSLVGVKNRGKRVQKELGSDFITTHGQRKSKGKTQEGTCIPKQIPVKVTAKLQQYRHFDTYKLVKLMEDADEKQLRSYFGRTTPSEFAWRLFNTNGEEIILVLGSHVQDLVDNCYLEGELLQYYMYKLDQKQKHSHSQMQDSQDDGKYSKSAFMMPQAFVEVQSNDVDGIKAHVMDFIRSIPDGVAELFIPIYSGTVSHWTLLHFNFFNHEWQHYNSLAKGTTRTACSENALLMMRTCNIPIRQRQEDLRAKQPLIDPIEDTTYLEADCTQQKKSDCLLFVCYFIKSIMKRQSLPTARKDVLNKIQMKRIKMAVQLVSDMDHSNGSEG